MRLNHIRDLVAVIDSGSIRAAARKLGVSQPAVTKSVRGLEGELQLQLLKRTPQGVVPTAAGRAFVIRARAIQAELRKAQEEMSQLAGNDTGSVAFGVGPLAAAVIVPEAIRQFRQQCPQAVVRIVEGFAPALIAQVRDETLDFALGPRFEPFVHPSIAFRPLFREDWVVVVRKGHPLSGARSLAELAGAEWLTSAGQRLGRGWLDQTFAGAGLAAPRALVHCDSVNVLIAVLSKTDMIGMVGRRMLAAVGWRDALVRVPIREPLPEATIGMFTRTDSPHTPVGARMAKIMSAVARRLARPA